MIFVGGSQGPPAARSL